MMTYMLFVFALAVATLLYVLSPFVFPHHAFVGVRLGAANSTSIRVWARAPDVPRFVVRARAHGTRYWVESPSTALLAAADHTGVAVLAGLAAATRYEYSVEFERAATSGAPPPAPLGGHFSTLPLEHQKADVRIAFGSCTMKSQSAGYELTGLSRLLDLSPRPALWLMLGDLIYADVPLSGVGLGADVSLYRAHYRRTLADTHAVALERAVPGFYMLDDHEIRNDWKSHTGATFGAAAKVWREYAGALNPQQERRGGGVGHWYTFAVAHVCVFVADTRTQRSADTILGAEQLAEAVA